MYVQRVPLRPPLLVMSGGPTRAITSPSLMPGLRNLRCTASPRGSALRAGFDSALGTFTGADRAAPAVPLDLASAPARLPLAVDLGAGAGCPKGTTETVDGILVEVAQLAPGRAGRVLVERAAVVEQALVHRRNRGRRQDARARRRRRTARGGEDRAAWLRGGDRSRYDTAFAALPALRPRMDSRTRLAARVAEIAPFHVMEVQTAARALEAAGRSVIHMEIGEPDFPTPAPVVAAAQRAIAGGRLYYTSALGPACAARSDRAALRSTTTASSVDPARVDRDGRLVGGAAAGARAARRSRRAHPARRPRLSVQSPLRARARGRAGRHPGGTRYELPVDRRPDRAALDAPHARRADRHRRRTRRARPSRADEMRRIAGAVDAPAAGGSSSTRSTSACPTTRRRAASSSSPTTRSSSPASPSTST